VLIGRRSFFTLQKALRDGIFKVKEHSLLATVLFGHGWPEVEPMSINIQAKTDYSSLFSSISGSKSDSFNSMSWLKDYGLVKSGAYGKLMKAYYAEDKTSESASKIVSKDVNKATGKNTASESYGKVSEAAGSVKDSIEKIRNAAKEDTDLLVSAVKGFVKSYNSMIEAAADKDVVNDSSISSRITVLSSLSNGYTEKMNSIGLIAGKDGKIEIDEERLKAADASDIKDLFAERSSYGYSVSVSAGMVQSNANYAATRNSIYNSSGMAAGVSNGYMFDTIT